MLTRVFLPTFAPLLTSSFSRFLQVFVNVSAFLNWDLSKLKEGPELAWTDEYFYLCWVVRKGVKLWDGSRETDARIC